MENKWSWPSMVRVNQRRYPQWSREVSESLKPEDCFDHYPQWLADLIQAGALHQAYDFMVDSVVWVVNTPDARADIQVYPEDYGDYTETKLIPGDRFMIYNGALLVSRSHQILMPLP